MSGNSQRRRDLEAIKRHKVLVEKSEADSMQGMQVNTGILDAHALTESTPSAPAPEPDRAPLTSLDGKPNAASHDAGFDDDDRPLYQPPFKPRPQPGQYHKSMSIAEARDAALWHRNHPDHGNYCVDGLAISRRQTAQRLRERGFRLEQDTTGYVAPPKIDGW